MRETQRPPSGTPFVRTMGPRAQLRLRAGLPVERELVLGVSYFAFGEGGPARRTLELELNGIAVGTLAVGPELGEHALVTPAEAWVAGDNVLELQLSAAERQPGVQPPILALSHLRYGDARRVDVDVAARRLRLENGTGADWALELRGPSRLDFAGVADAEGELSIRLGFVDPATGREEGEDDPPLRVRVGDGAFGDDLVLADPGGRVVRLRLAWRATHAGRGAVELTRLELTESGSFRRPPIVFISIDTLAARHMSCYGYPRPTTPRLDAFADDAVRFAHCVANAPWTGPSYFSQVTGVYGNAFRFDVPEDATQEEKMNAWTLTGNRWTLAERLQAAGYRTAAFVDSPWLVEGQGFAQGFEHFDASANDIDPADPEGGIRHILPRVRRWLDSIDPDEPFFLFVQAIDVHGPYVPDDEHRGSLPPDATMDLEHAAPFGRQAYMYGRVPAYIARGLTPEGALPQLMRTATFIAAYDEEIRAMDADVGGFLEELRGRGLYDRSAIVFSSDHGESMIDHEWYFGHGLLYEDTLHVPLILRLPAGDHSGRVIPDTVQLMDLFPTLAELAHAGPPREYVQGRSLLPLLAGEPYPPRPILSEAKLLEAHSITLDGWKLIESFPEQSSLATLITYPPAFEWLLEEFPVLEPRRELGMRVRDFEQLEEQHPGLEARLREVVKGPVYELYDLRSDPREARNLAAEEPERVAALLRELRVRQELSRRARALAVPDGVQVELSEDALETLRNLGYTDSLEGD